MESSAVQTYSSTNAAQVEAACALHGLTQDEFRVLHRESVAAKELAYCPYSKFQVGAALLTRLGKYIAGANMENASYPVGTCAERVALARAHMDGHRDFKAIAVVTNSTLPASPCGMCRQFMREFCDLSFPVLMFDANGDFAVMKLGEVGA
ncbi:uncharacterized protein E0L32_003555 [Thyridium curvatum]|uniref:Cytidine deaminase n=1 Tax=Thyridium curvatum TaxID=1093900 RepID=A0A507BD60_9PEZI|nr:uncharacterized protein E0L32_003555 [Thyridium curvatum]TPX16614.1 hypothetical protein E0L32_003555 [Thyridium curvatum]